MGLDLGLEAAGLNPLAANEFDPIICETIRKNRPRLRLYGEDIRELTAERLLKDLQLEREEPFAVVGGPPCQAFSTAGRRLGLNDDRGNVFLHFIKLIAGLRPKYAIFENVRGLLSAPLQHRPQSTWKRVSRAMPRRASRRSPPLRLTFAGRERIHNDIYALQHRELWSATSSGADHIFCFARWQGCAVHPADP